MFFSQFRHYHLLEQGVALYLKKLECPSPKGALLQVYLRLDEWFCQCISAFSQLSTLSKKWVRSLSKLLSSSPKNALAQWFQRRRCFSFLNVFLLVRNCLPLEKGLTVQLNKIESPSPNNALCQVWLKLAQWFLRRFFNFVNVFLL